ncbi:hypothetical protein EV424DRAFT_1532628 [Suillus variegatus]|nr:hypothetical protein EV424DRAFT_1532628 [Suillus variegatus]
MARGDRHSTPSKMPDSSRFHRMCQPLSAFSGCQLPSSFTSIPAAEDYRHACFQAFGTSPATPVHSSTPSLPARSSTYTATQFSVSGSTIPPPSQQQRLAEFATILGDFNVGNFQQAL